MPISNCFGKFPGRLLLGKALLAILPVLLFFDPFAIASDLNDPEPKRVLVIYSFHEGLPWERIIDENLRATLAAKSTEPIELNVEHADRIRYPGDAYLQKFVDLLRHKYSRLKMDIVIGIDDEATDMLLKHGEELFPGVPTVFVTAERKALLRDSLKSNMTSFLWGPDIQGSIDLIYKILPETRQILVITGSSMNEHAMQNMVRDAMRGYPNRDDLNYLAEITIEDLMDKVARLPELSAIFYMGFSRDSEGKNFVPLEILSDISRKANAPTFGILDTYLGNGIVGGRLLSAEVQGRRCAEVCVRILGGESPGDIVPEHTRNILMFDSRQLKRWGINEATLPPDSIVRYKEFSFWQQYRWHIIGLIAFGLIQTSIIILLWVQWKKRCLAEIKTHEREVMYRTVADYTYDWEYWVNYDGTLHYVSPSCERISGYTVQEFIDNPSLFREIIVPEDRGIWDEHNRISREELRERELEIRIQRPDDEIRWIEHACQPVYDDQGNSLGFRASNRDITKRKLIEEKSQSLRDELAHMNRVSIIGVLTSAIAHEVNQPLAAILSNAQAAIRFLNHDNPDLDEVREALLAVSRDDKRAAEVIIRLRKMVKKEEPVYEPFEINAAIETAIHLFESEITLQNTSVSKDLKPGIPALYGDPIQIQQVIINLLSNAMEAIKNQPADARHILLSTRFDGDKGVAVTIIDSGPGLTTDQIKTVFDSFYTTKAEGMGLGLAISRSIIEAHGGRIRAENCPEGGGMFTFWIPIGKDV
jgi:PAS domain S-box-containing protein